MLIRRLHPRERPLFAAHLKRLSDDDRRFRFAHAVVTDARIDAYVEGIADGDVVLGGFDDDRLVGAVHVGLGDGAAEIGVSVDSDRRGCGIGAELVTHAVHWARNRGAVRLYTLCLADNRAMAALARRQGMEIRSESGTAEAYLPLPPPDLVSVTDEVGCGMQSALSDWADLVQSCLRLGAA